MTTFMLCVVSATGGAFVGVVIMCILAVGRDHDE